MHGDVVRVSDQNVLVVVLLPLAILAFIRRTMSRLGYATPRLPKWRPWMLVVAGMIVFGFLIMRNLPGLEYLRTTASKRRPPIQRDARVRLHQAVAD
jgi:hypothetical protein